MIKEVLKKLRIATSYMQEGAYVNIPVSPVDFPMCSGWTQLPSSTNENTLTRWTTTYVDSEMAIIFVVVPAGELYKKQVHDDADEHIHLNSGSLRDEVNGTAFQTGENYFIPAGTVHQITALEDSVYTTTYKFKK